jgi:hypothetical protein
MWYISRYSASVNATKGSTYYRMKLDCRRRRVLVYSVQKKHKYQNSIGRGVARPSPMHLQNCSLGESSHHKKKYKRFDNRLWAW